MAPAPLCFVAALGALAVYVRADDQWVAQKGGQSCDTAGLRAQASLLWLPLLEQDYPTVRQVLRTSLSAVGAEQALRHWTTFPVQELLLLGLAPGNSVYWVDRALAWAAHVEPGPAVLPHLQRVAGDPSLPQPTRHRAKRLFHTGRG